MLPFPAATPSTHQDSSSQFLSVTEPLVGALGALFQRKRLAQSIISPRRLRSSLRESSFIPWVGFPNVAGFEGRLNRDRDFDRSRCHWGFCQ